MAVTAGPRTAADVIATRTAERHASPSNSTESAEPRIASLLGHHPLQACAPVGRKKNEMARQTSRKRREFAGPRSPGAHLALTDRIMAASSIPGSINRSASARANGLLAPSPSTGVSPGLDEYTTNVPSRTSAGGTHPNAVNLTLVDQPGIKGLRWQASTITILRRRAPATALSSRLDGIAARFGDHDRAPAWRPLESCS